MIPYEMLYFLFRRKGTILFGVLIGVVAAGATFKLKPRTYRSEAKLLVRYVSDTVIAESDSAGQGVLRPGRPGDAVIGTEVDILTSPEIAEATARALAMATTNAPAPVGVAPSRGLVRDLAAAAARALAIVSAGAPPTASPVMTPRKIVRNLDVRIGSGSNTIELRFDGPSPAVAQHALSEVIQAYFHKHHEVHRDPAGLEFLAQQTEELRKRVADAEEELRRIKDEAGIVSLADTRALITMRTQDLDRATRDRESALIATRARLEVLQRQITHASTSGADTPAAGQPPAAIATDREDAARQLAELQRREAELLGVYTEDSLPVRSLRKQIEALRLVVGRRRVVTGATNQTDNLIFTRPMHDTLLTDVAAYQAEEAALVAQLADLSKQMQAAQAEAKRIETWETQIVRLERNREMFDEQYRHASQRLESARADSSKDERKVTNIPLVQPPTLPDRPMMEGLRKLLALIFAGCAGCGLALAYVREYVLDHSIRHLAEVQRLLRTPLLATLPRLRRDRLNPGPRGSRAGRSMSKTRELDSACEVVAQMVREQVKQETRTLLVGFTAPHVGAGVTTVAQRVANAMQFSGIKNVLLTTIAADGQFTGKLLGGTTRDTESEDLSAVEGDGGDQTLAVACHADPVQEPYSSSTAITPSVLDEFNRHDYDCVLFDLPPPGTSDVTVRLLPRLDGVVLVLETLATPRSQALACMRQFEQLRCEVYGAVLNKFCTPVPAWLLLPNASPAEETPAAAA